jgi:uncharacterized membrane protein YphA (DoxX/SURF4 family)
MIESPKPPQDHSFRNSLGDWALRAGIAITFLLFGLEKFSSDPGSPWVKFFASIGAGQWFRCLTGVVEVAGAILLLTPRTVLAGLALLGSSMAGAILILVFVVHRPANAFLASAILIALTIFWASRRT